MPRKVSRRNTKRNTKKQTKRKTTKRSNNKTRSKRTSIKRIKKYTGRKLIPRRAIIFPEPIMNGGGIDKEMIGI